jgi:hypothetical protein
MAGAGLGPDRATACFATLAVILAAGCTQRHESDFARVEQARGGALEALKARGAKFESKTYPQGTAWSINMSGLTVTDEMLDQLMMVGNITELNLSKSTVTDVHMEGVSKIGGKFLMKLDLSQTAVTDAGFEQFMGKMGLLTNLNLTGTKVTPAAVERFKAMRLSQPTLLEQSRRPTIQL